MKRDIWRMSDGSWGAEVERNGVGVGVRYVSLWRAIWHVLTVRRPDEFGSLVGRRQEAVGPPPGMTQAEWDAVPVEQRVTASRVDRVVRIQRREEP